MSDAITLDVLSSSPVQLDAGDADPIAREEIAALATRVTTVEGDVSGLSTRMGAVEGDVTALDGRMDTAEGDISALESDVATLESDVTALGTTVDGIDARVEAIEADYVTSEDVMDALGGEAPALVAGSSRALLGDAETASWRERITAADGAALIEAVQGNTLRWNQLIKPNPRSITSKGVTYTNTSDGKVTLDGTATGAEIFTSSLALSVVSGHKYLYRGADVSRAVYATINGIGYNINSGSIYTATSNVVSTTLSVAVGATYAGTYECYPQLFDLTAMFGAGNEPSTVAEFEALYPLPYYPYDAGSLLPVRMEGIETVAADESWSSECTIPAATYFPQGLRSAGSVYDELRADAAVTRVGERAYQSGDESDASVITDGTVTHYELATPTVTPIDPPLPLSYRVGAGGTERVMVASGTTSAPPVFVTRYPLDPADLAASIAPVDGPTAKTNHQVGDLIMLGFTLCKATQVIVTGETIAIGTNVTKTTVAAELAAFSE